MKAGGAEPVQPGYNKTMIRVLFICLGNICRSPMAEAVLRHKVREAGFADKIEVDSAGTGHWHAGEQPHSGTRKILDKYGVSYAGMRARQIDRSDLTTFDYILTMDEMNLSDVRRMVNSGTKATAKIIPLLNYALDTGVTEVPDPYYDGRFAEVYALVDAACDGLLEEIRRERLTPTGTV